MWDVKEGKFLRYLYFGIKLFFVFLSINNFVYFFYKVYDICIIFVWLVKNLGLLFKICLRLRFSK